MRAFLFWASARVAERHNVTVSTPRDFHHTRMAPRKISSEYLK